ncbi:MAG: MarR family transcriptional regulator [Dehalococcoidales bacterium]|nr:MarR family transcriptional regulator [Dehalococcoidales bacterium]
MPEKRKSQALEQIMDDLFEILPVMHKKLVNVLNEGSQGEISHYHFIILNMIDRSDGMSVSSIGRRISLSRPQMTAMIDKLVSLGLVVRLPDSSDRRIIRVSITPAGRNLLSRARKRIKLRLKKKLVLLDEKDLEAFASAVNNLRVVGQKLE